MSYIKKLDSLQYLQRLAQSCKFSRGTDKTGVTSPFFERAIAENPKISLQQLREKLLEAFQINVSNE